MFKLNSFQDLCMRPILEASLLEVQPQRSKNKQGQPGEEKPYYGVFVPKRTGSGRVSVSPDDTYLFDLPTRDEVNAIHKVCNLLSQGGDVSQLKYVYSQIVLSTLGLVESQIFSKSKIITHTNKSKMANAENAFEQFTEKYKIDSNAPIDAIKLIFADEFNKDAISNYLGFNIFDLFNKEKTWAGLAEKDKKTGLTKLERKILGTYSHLMGYDTESRERYLNKISSIYQNIENFTGALDRKMVDEVDEDNIRESITKKWEDKKDELLSKGMSQDEFEEKLENEILATIKKVRKAREIDYQKRRKATTAAIGHFLQVNDIPKEEVINDDSKLKDIVSATGTVLALIDSEEGGSDSILDRHEKLLNKYDDMFTSVGTALKTRWEQVKKKSLAAAKKAENAIQDTDYSAIDWSAFKDSSTDKETATKQRTTEEDNKLYRQVLIAAEEATAIINQLIVLASHIDVVGKDSESDISPNLFNKFLTDVTRISGWLHTTGISNELNKLEDEEPSETVGDYLFRINRLLREKTVPKTITEHVAKAFANEAAKSLRLFQRELRRKGYEGGLTINNVLDYIKNDDSWEALTARENLESLYGLTEDDLTTENFPTFRSFIGTLYKSFRYWQAWFSAARKAKAKESYRDGEKTTAAGQVIKNLTPTYDNLTAKIEKDEAAMATGNEGNIQERADWNSGMLSVPITCKAAAVFRKDYATKLGLPTNIIAYDFGTVNKKELKDIISDELTPGNGSYFYAYATSEFKPYLDKLIASKSQDEIDAEMRMLKPQINEQVLQKPGRSSSRKSHSLKGKEAQIEKDRKKQDIYATELELANQAKYGINRGERIEDWSKDVTSEDDTREEGYYSFIVNTADKDLLEPLADRLAKALNSESAQYTVTVSGIADDSDEDNDKEYSDGLVSIKKAARLGTNAVRRAINFALFNKAVIITAFPATAPLFGKENAVDIIKKRLNKFTTIINAMAEAGGFKINGENIYLKRQEQTRSKSLIDVKLGEFSVAVAAKVGDRIITTKETEDSFKKMGELLGGSDQSKKAAKITQLIKRNVPLANIKLKESTNVESVLECLNEDIFHQPKVKYIPNKDRYKRGYLVQEWRQKCFLK